MYQGVNIVKFDGLNSSVSPELIGNGEARDILNLRMEKVGKLVSRDGYVPGLYVQWTDAEYIGGPAYKSSGIVEAYMKCEGIVGIGELILEEKWDTIDTDRVMVYFIRGQWEFDLDNFESKNREVVLIAPITGSYQNKLIVGRVTGFNIDAERDSQPQGKSNTGVILWAPKKKTAYRSSVIEDPWIKHYIKTSQYRNHLIISDRTNGDMILEDEYSRDSGVQGVKNAHELHLRPNTLQKFAIDSVILEPRLDTGQENDLDAGVNNGMALYKYVLQKKYFKVTEAPYSNTFGNPDWVLAQSALVKIGFSDHTYDVAIENLTKKILEYITNNYKMDTLLTAYFSDCQQDTTSTDYGFININQSRPYLFSNAEQPGEFDSLFDEPKFEDEDVIDEKGVLHKESAPNVYIWDDFQRVYYPCNGKDYEQYSYYLREADRMFTKLQSGAARITKLETKKNAGKYAPLGVWRYKFVWDFGDNIYSVPSTELLAPDIMWSQLKDEEISADGSDYIRERKYSYTDFAGASVAQNVNSDYKYSVDPYQTFNLPQHPNLWIYDNNKWVLSKFGELVYDLKSKLYSGMNAKYGIKAWTGYDSINTLVDNGLDNHKLLDKSDFGVFCTLNLGTQDIEFKGYIFEGLDLQNNLTGNYSGSDAVVPWICPLVLPLFQTIGKQATYNSLFDDQGRLRLLYPNTESWNSGEGTITDRIVKKQIVFDESLPLIFWDSTGQVAFGSTFLLDKKDIYLNFVPIQWDQNNDPDGTYQNDDLDDIRTPSVLRAVKSEFDRLFIVREDTPVEVLDRMVLQGIAEMELNRYGEDVDVTAQYRTEGSVYRLDYDERRGPIVVWNYANGSWTVVGGQTEAPIKNLSVYLYGEGDRLLAPEQITAYFPSSLLFRAPRLGIKIADADVPARAKRLLIFRTLCTHDNSYDPQQYGYVDEIKIERRNGACYSDIPGDGEYDGIYYFDKIRDDELDFSTTPDKYIGLYKELKSRFNMPLNERMYYFNFEETYQPLTPRKSEWHDTPDPLGLVLDTNMAVKDSTVDNEGFDSDVYIRYKYLYKDVNGVRSEAAETVYDLHVQGAPDARKVVVLYFLPSAYDSSIDCVEVYRAVSDQPNPDEYKLIGTVGGGVDVKIDDEGVFVDYNQPATTAIPSLLPDVENYESGMRWSEPYHPDWIKPESFIEVKAGDGKQITGADSLYGNVIVAKETSLHRFAIQSRDPDNPISRVDELTPEIGCIAPLSFINVDNTLFFLSWKGLMMYDNNQFQKIDQSFTEELQYILSVQEEGAIRDASCGYNRHYNEIWLNIPMLKTIADDGKQTDKGHNWFHGYKRELLGHIYAINAEKHYSTKFGYRGTLENPIINAAGQNYYLKEVVNVRQFSRMYFDNSLGELRSADIMPTCWGSLAGISRTGVADNQQGYWWAGIYVETPYKALDGTIFRDRDRGLDSRYMQDLAAHSSSWTDDIYQAWNIIQDRFPKDFDYPIRVELKSKFITGEIETIMKRVRKCLVNMFSKGNIEVRGITIPIEASDERIDNLVFDPALYNTFKYNPTQADVNPVTLYAPLSTMKNVLSFIPDSPYDLYSDFIDETEMFSDQFPGYNDYMGKPIRFSIEIEAELRTQINELVIHWRPIYTYIG